MTVATVRVFILLVLQVSVSDSIVMLSNFEHMSHFDDKQGIDCIIMNKRVVTLCECGTLCGSEINACKSFFYTKDEGLCSLYNEDLFQLTLVNVPGSKGYSLARHTGEVTIPVATTEAPMATSKATIPALNIAPAAGAPGGCPGEESDECGDD